MSEKETKAIPELTKDNYPLWSRKINAYLRTQGLFKLVHGEEPRPTDDDDKKESWDERLSKAAGIIELTLDDTNAHHCEGLFGNAVALWAKLELVHNAKSPGSRFGAMNTLFNIRMEDNETLDSLITHTKAAMQRVKNLRPAGTYPTTTSTDSSDDSPTPAPYTLATLDDELIIMTLLRALPESYGHLSSLLYIQPDLNLEMVERAFRAEDNHRKQAATDSATAFRAFVPHHNRSHSTPNTSQNAPNRHPRNPSSNRWCNHCRRNDHYDSNCWVQYPHLRPPRNYSNHRTHANLADTPAQANATTTTTTTTPTTAPTAAVNSSNASTSPPPEAQSNLNCDTGATRIMMGDESFFASLRPFVREIRLADGASIYSQGEGEVVFQPWVDGQYSVEPVIFPNVLFAPDLKSNLISVLSMVQKHGYEIRINSVQMEFYRKGILEMTARIDQNCVAYLNGRVLTTENAHSASTCPLDRSLWHRRFGHFHHDGIDKLIRNKAVNDLELDSNKRPDPICVACISGKQTRAVHTKPMERAKEILDRIFVDLHGPIPIEAYPDRSKYWFPIVDDMSGFTHIALIRTKDQALQTFEH